MAILLSIVIAAAWGAALAQIEIETGFAAYSIVVLIIPIGAMACGFVSGLAYATLARAMRVPREQIWLVVGVVLAIVTHLSIYVAGYLNIPAFIRADLSFVDYVQIVIEESEIFGQVGNASGSGRAGSLGYAFEALLTLGFFIGSIGAVSSRRG